MYGNVSAYLNGIEANYQSSVYVTGDVTAGEDYAVQVWDDSQVWIDGTLTQTNPAGAFILVDSVEKTAGEFDAVSLEDGYWQYSEPPLQGAASYVWLKIPVPPAPAPTPSTDLAGTGDGNGFLLIALLCVAALGVGSLIVAWRYRVRRLTKE